MAKENEKDIGKARRYCLRLITLRSRSLSEIEDRLEGAGFSPDAARETVEKLKSEGLIDDLAFARQWVEYRVRTSPRGRAMMRAELGKKGITEDVIERTLSEDSGFPSDREMASSLVESRIGDDPAPRDMKLKGRLYQYLIGKGFSGDTAEDVLNEVFVSEE